jgi:hypothetical protein
LVCALSGAGTRRRLEHLRALDSSSANFIRSEMSPHAGKHLTIRLT